MFVNKKKTFPSNGPNSKTASYAMATKRIRMLERWIARIFCFCFSVLDHYGHLVIVKVWGVEQQIMKLHEIEREILSCRRSRGWGPVTSVILSGQTQHWAGPGISHRDCSVRTDCTPEIVGSFNRISRSLQPKPPVWIEFFKLDDWWLIWFPFLYNTANTVTALQISPLSPLLSPYGENPQVRPSHSSGRQSFT